MSQEFVAFTEEESKLLLEIISSSLDINNRVQFFRWLQGSFQSLIPHEILLCAVNIKNQPQLYFESFISTRYMSDEHVKSVTSPLDGIIQRVINSWEKVNRPIFVADGLNLKDAGNFIVPFEESAKVLNQIELKNIMGHGVANKEGDVITFLVFHVSMAN
jgi:hypothetical protein